MQKPFAAMPIFVIQEHDASRRHFDLRLQVGDKLKSWAVASEPSPDPNEQRSAIATQDSPLDFADYEGVLTEPEYGEGEAVTWDRGSYHNLRDDEMERCIDDGRVEVWLEGERISGGYSLIRDERRPNDGWVLVKMDDEAAQRRGVSPTGGERVTAGARSEAGATVAAEAKPEVEQLEFSNERKVMFPDEGITKRDLRRYYQRIADRILPELADRPMLARRFPDGAEGEGILLRKIPDHFPRWIERVRLENDQGEETEYILCNDEATLLYLVDQACIEFYVWSSRVDRPGNPDRMIFDLDPEDARTRAVRAGARALREVLDELSLPSFVKTTGQRGLHIVVPLDRSAEFEEVRVFANDVARIVSARAPDKFTTEARGDARGGRLYIGGERNVLGRPTIATYSVRAKPGAPVAAPIEWRELYRRAPRSDQYHMRNIFRRLGQKESAWHSMPQQAIKLSAARALLRRVQPMSGREPESESAEAEHRT